jgi:hypothetical protein
LTFVNKTYNTAGCTSINEAQPLSIVGFQVSCLRFTLGKEFPMNVGLKSGCIPEDIVERRIISAVVGN